MVYNPDKQDPAIGDMKDFIPNASYEEVKAKLYHIDDENLAKSIFKSIPLSTLNSWLKNLSLNDEEGYLKQKIKVLEDEIEKKHNAYLDSIKPLLSKIEEIKDNIAKLKLSPDLNERAIRIHKIVAEAIEQDPNGIASNAKDLLIGKKYDPIIDINKISSLTEEEKEELYQMYIEEFKRLAGI